MSIQFTCTSCGKRFAVPAEAAGRSVKCAGCGTKLRIPGAAATKEADKGPSMDLDWSLMEAASKPEPEKTTGPVKDPNAVDWDAIAAPLSAQAMAEASTQMAGRGAKRTAGLDETGEPLDAVNNRFKPGRVDYFILEALASLPAGLAYLPQIFAIMMIGLGVGVIMVGMGMGFGFVLAKMAGPEPWIITTVIIIMLLPLICFYGYVARFWTSVADDAAEGHMATSLPNMEMGQMLRAILLWVLFFLTYILPIVTLPLAPAAFLAMGRTNGYQAFNLPWVVRSSMRSWVHVLIALCFVPFFISLNILVGSLLFPPVAEHVISMTKNMPRRVQDFYVGMAFHYVMVPVGMFFIASICRMIGLVGKFNPMIYETLPKRGKWPHGFVGAMLGLAIFVFVTKPLLSTQSESVIQPMAQYVMGRAATKAREESRQLPQSPPVVVPVNPYVVPQPAQPPVNAQPDFTKMNPVQIIQYHTSQIRSTDLNRSRTALIWLSTAQPVASERPAVIRELEQALTGRYADLAIAAMEKWSDDPLRLVVSRLHSPTMSVSIEAANVLATMTPEEDKRAGIAQTISQLITMRVNDDLSLALLRAYEHWAVDPFDVLAAELRRGRPNQTQIIESLARSNQPRAAKELVAHMSRGGRGIIPLVSELLGKMAPEAEVEKALDEALKSGNEMMMAAAAQSLAIIGTAAALPSLRPLVTHPSQAVAQAARAAVRKLAPDEMTPAKEALLDLPLIDTRTSTRSGAALEALTKMEPTDGDREAVIDALIKKLETIQSGQFGTTTNEQMNAAFKRWADDGAMGRMLEQLEKQKNNVTVRRGLLSALGALGNRKSIQAIVDYMENDPQAVSDTLIAMGRPAVEDTLLRVLRSGSEQTKLHIIRILEKIGGPNALPQLIALAKADAVNTTLRFPARTAVLAIQEREKNQK